jgi:hypothetical protein
VAIPSRQLHSNAAGSIAWNAGRKGASNLPERLTSVSAKGTAHPSLPDAHDLLSGDCTSVQEHLGWGAQAQALSEYALLSIFSGLILAKHDS